MLKFSFVPNPGIYCKFAFKCVDSCLANQFQESRLNPGSARALQKAKFSYSLLF
jgi:hypothetical protein